MISFSPTGADFQAIVAAVLDLEGEEATQAWLEGIKANGTVYDGNNVVLESVNAGESAIGIIYHYYWYRDQAEAGENSDNTELYFFGNQDPGAFLSDLRARACSPRRSTPTEAQQFVAYLTSEEGQQALADSYALEYPLNPAVSLEPPVKPLSELAAADRRDLRPRRRQGRRDDDRGRVPLSRTLPRSGRGPRPAGGAGRRDQPAAAGLRRGVLGPARPGRGRRLPGPAAGR